MHVLIFFVVCVYCICICTNNIIIRSRDNTIMSCYIDVQQNNRTFFIGHSKLNIHYQLKLNIHYQLKLNEVPITYIETLFAEPTIL